MDHDLSQTDLAEIMWLLDSTVGYNSVVDQRIQQLVLPPLFMSMDVMSDRNGHDQNASSEFKQALDATGCIQKLG